MIWTVQQVMAIAPDDASRSAGKGLANVRKWISTGRNECVLWGECQGSGSTPYQTQVELNEPAFRCTCPSRKFPCKHALGLLLIFAEQPGSIAQMKPPAWVTEWLAKREVSQAKKQEREAAPSTKASPEKDSKTAKQREARVQAGLQELHLWLRDRIRQGLANLPVQGYEPWDSIAKRMVDAQAPGVARMLREAGSMAFEGNSWGERILERLGLIYLLIEAYQHLEGLPKDLQADVRTLIGWSYKKEELLEQPGVQDSWAVLAREVEEEDRLRAQSTWLWGIRQNKPALLLDFSPRHQPLDAGYVPGTSIDAELVFYPSCYPLRALVKERTSEPQSIQEPPGYPDFQAMTSLYAEALSVQPWLDSFPVLLKEVVPFRKDSEWLLMDRNREMIVLHADETCGWRLLAISGGMPISLFGEWDGYRLKPHSAFVENRCVHLSSSWLTTAVYDPGASDEPPAAFVQMIS